MTPTSLLNAVEHLGEMPDVIAHAGGLECGARPASIGAGYLGADTVSSAR